MTPDNVKTNLTTVRAKINIVSNVVLSNSLNILNTALNYVIINVLTCEKWTVQSLCKHPFVCVCVFPIRIYSQTKKNVCTGSVLVGKNVCRNSDHSQASLPGRDTHQMMYTYEHVVFSGTPFSNAPTILRNGNSWCLSVCTSFGAIQFSCLWDKQDSNMNHSFPNAYRGGFSCTRFKNELCLCVANLTNVCTAREKWFPNVNIPNRENINLKTNKLVCEKPWKTLSYVCSMDVLFRILYWVCVCFSTNKHIGSFFSLRFSSFWLYEVLFTMPFLVIISVLCAQNECVWKMWHGTNSGWTISPPSRTKQTRCNGRKKARPNRSSVCYPFNIGTMCFAIFCGAFLCVRSVCRIVNVTVVWIRSIECITFFFQTN